MSSSTAQRFGAKTYSRNRESSASRAFDEIVSNKPPIKPATAHTKWGKTNFKALRESQRLKGELSQSKKQKLDHDPEVNQDPFSFDTDTDRKRSPVKKHVVLQKQTAGPRLPGTRIATRGSMNEASGSEDNPMELEAESPEESEESDFSFKPSASMAKRTYTRMPFANPAETKKKLVAEPVESKPLASFGFEEDDDESAKPEASHSTNEGEEDSTEDIDDDEVSFNFKMPQFMRKEKKDEDEDADNFSVKKQPIRTYGTPRSASSAQAERPSSPPTGFTTSAITRGPHSPRRASRYSDPKLLQEYKRMYNEKTGGKEPDVVGALTNSTVVSKAQVKGNKGSTLIVVCKPKGIEKEQKETVQNKYFMNRSKHNKADRAIKIDVMAEDEEEEETTEGSEQTEASVEKTKDFQFDSDESSNDSKPWPTNSQPITYKSRTQARAHSNSESTVQVRNKIFKSAYIKTSSGASLSSSEPVPSSQDSPTSTSSSQPSTSSNSSAITLEDQVRKPVLETKKPVAVSSKRSYRIFKSRGRPAQEEAKETKEETPEVPQGEPPSLDLEPPTLEPIHVLDDSPQASPPCLLAQDEESGKEEIDEVMTLDVPMDTAPCSSQETDKSSVSKSSANTSYVDDFEMDVESDSQSVVSEDSHDSQDDSQGSLSQPQTRKIFKSKNSKNAKRSADLRRKVLQSPKKSPTKAVYNPRSWQGSLDPDSKDNKPITVPEKSKAKPAVSSKSLKGFAEPEPKKTLKMTRAVHWPSRGVVGDEAYTSLRVNKEHRQLFTVVRNVKQAFEVQESGETQDFMDDVEYLLDGLQDTEPMSIRCLSCIQLAGKCTLPAFRMHLRAHGTMTKIFNLLHDANKNPSLALGTATIMYMLSKDRLNMDLEQESLDLMLSLLEVDSYDKTEEVQYTDAENKELERTRAKVYELCEQMQGVGTKLDLDTISVGNLAMESLLSLTSRKAGEWFKEELRSQGALDHIVDTVACCSQYVGSDIGSDEKSLSNLKKLDRCLRVLENITYMNTDNQSYVISYKDARLITSVCSVLRACEESMPLYPVREDPEQNKEVKESLGFIIISCVLAILRVLLNVTHDNEFGSTKVGEQDGVMVGVLLCVFSTTQFAPTDMKFDILVLCIGLLINMVEHCLVNRRHLMDSEITLSSGKISSVKALVQLFLERETAAREIEDQEKEDGEKEEEKEEANKSGEWHESEAGVQWIVASAEKLRKKNSEEAAKPIEESNNEEEPTPLDDEETFTKALHKAGKHMENSIIASYVALLIGCLIQDNMMYVERVRAYLPTGSFESMIKVLKKFLGFMNLTKAIGNTGGQPIARVIDILEAC